MLTPLQEVASRIYAAKYNTVANPDLCLHFNTTIALEDAITEAKALLETCKPEPLEWEEIPHPKEGFSSTHYSKGGEFKIIYSGSEIYYLCDLAHSFKEDRIFFQAYSIKEAKQFAEHIRTR